MCCALPSALLSQCTVQKYHFMMQESFLLPSVPQLACSRGMSPSKPKPEIASYATTAPTSALHMLDSSVSSNAPNAPGALARNRRVVSKARGVQLKSKVGHSLSAKAIKKTQSAAHGKKTKASAANGMKAKAAANCRKMKATANGVKKKSQKVKKTEEANDEEKKA